MKGRGLMMELCTFSNWLAVWGSIVSFSSRVWVQPWLLPILLELGRFAHRISDIGKIGANLNIGELVASVCRYVIVTRLHAFNKLHSPLHASSAWLRILNRWPTGKVKRGYVIITAMVEQSVWHDQCGTAAYCLISFHPWTAAECGGGSKQG